MWDGRAWQPVAVVNWEPAAAAVIPPADAPALVIDEVPIYFAPEEVMRAAPPVDNFPVAAPSAPLWQRPVRGTSTYLYVAGGAVVLIMVMIVLNSLSVVPWHFFGSDSPVAVTSAGPLPPAKARTEFEHADRFLNLSLGPALDAVNQTLPGMQVCNGTLSVSCFSALTAIDQEMKKLLLVIDRGDYPPCIAGGMTKMRGDLGEMETALQFALKGYQLNRSFDLNAGVKRFAAVGQSIQGDANAIDAAHKTQCNTLVDGP